MTSGHAGRHRPHRRLCMVVHGEYPQDVRVAREARAAVEAGFEVVVVATCRPGERRREFVDGVAVRRLPISHRRGAGGLAVFAEYVGFAVLASIGVTWLSLLGRIDVVQVHNPPDFLIVAAAIPKLFGARVVLDVHDLSSDMFVMRFANKPWARPVERALQAIERYACRFADVVITVHEPYRRELGRRGTPLEKTVVVLNSLDDSLLPETAQQPAVDPFRIVYHGTVTPHYGVDLLVQAFAQVARRIPRARLAVYGEGDAVPELLSIAEANSVADRIEMTGQVLPQAETLQRVAGASVGVIPNRPTQLNRFALSTKLFEYIALGIPVVAADLPTIREHFDESELMYFRAGDVESLADALLAVAADFDAAVSRAGKARRRYDQEYGWAIQAQRYRAVLHRLVGRNVGLEDAAGVT
jgi:glycosyltransferase involved in cell wall biosynthesis